MTVRPLDEKGKWQYKPEKEYLCIKNGKEQGFTAAEFKQAQGYERVFKYHKSTKYGWQNPSSERWNSEEQLFFWRKAWADVTNLYLGRAGQVERIDHRSHVERGLEE